MSVNFGFAILDLRLDGELTRRPGSTRSQIGIRNSKIPLRRRGFSFTEVMFAVVILGIGFIMVAGIFPVSLQQAKQTSEEITGAALARAGANYLVRVGDDNPLPPNKANMPATGLGAGSLSINVPVDRFATGNAAVDPKFVWESIVGNMVQSDDPRFAWTAMYRRDGDKGGETNPTLRVNWAPFAQVYVFALVSRVRDQFDVNVDGKEFVGPPNYLPNLQPKPIRLVVLNDVLDAGGMDLIAIFQDGTTLQEDYTGAAVEGAYVVVQNDEIKDPIPDVGRMNGRIFRLGPERLDMIAYFNTLVGKTPVSVFELQPGNDFAPDAGADGVLYDPGVPGTNIYGLDDILAIGVKNDTTVSPGALSIVDVNDFALGGVVGRSYEDPSSPDITGDGKPDFSGTSMAVGAYTTFVRIKL